ncbi:hypothetical protein JZ751_023142 [Albula glossodonta]|uniref:Uncharacterized protein n=1 Tax=Albula glossodonta TaxID=121402 RepID=A0A8T2PKW0_9TELE|nr:hypothetical protein JZ751_023142 [Albula glossodonta]
MKEKHALQIVSQSDRFFSQVKKVFTSFPVLRELELSLNGLYHLRVNAGDFPHLEVNEGDEPVWCGKSENLEPDYEEQREEDFDPEKFRGYEILLDANPDPDMVEPVDKVLKSKEVYKKEYEEAQTLLRDMREKYQTVYIKAGERPAVTESHKLTALEK